MTTVNNLYNSHKYYQQNIKILILTDITKKKLYCVTTVLCTRIFVTIFFCINWFNLLIKNNTTDLNGGNCFLNLILKKDLIFFIACA